MEPAVNPGMPTREANDQEVRSQNDITHQHLMEDGGETIGMTWSPQ
jgi:hypothetical protein